MLLGKVFGDNPPGRSMDTCIGNLVEPLAELRVEMAEIEKAAPEEKVLADVDGTDARPCLWSWLQAFGRKS